MGLLGNLGRVAETYMNEKERLLDSEDSEIRKRTFMGHLLWPHEVLRDTIIFLSIIATLTFYAYLIPPPLHSAADPIAQAGFVFLIGMFFSVMVISDGENTFRNSTFLWASR